VLGPIMVLLIHGENAVRFWIASFQIVILPDCPLCCHPGLRIVEYENGQELHVHLDREGFAVCLACRVSASRFAGRSAPPSGAAANMALAGPSGAVEARSFVFKDSRGTARVDLNLEANAQPSLESFEGGSGSVQHL
jgi:hypothetical protein